MKNAEKPIAFKHANVDNGADASPVTLNPLFIL